MMKNLLVAMVATSVVLLTGCASDANVSALSKKVDQLSQQVENLKTHQAALTSQVANNTTVTNSAKESAQRANERIDHIAHSYTK